MADKKERILDLMRRGVITNDEALELLEKAEQDSTGALEEAENEITGVFTKSKSKDSKKETVDTDGFQNHRVDAGESIKSTFNTAADKLVEVFKGLSKTVDDSVDFSKGFPKVRTAEKTVEREISEVFHSVNLDVKAGKVLINKGESTRVMLDYKVYGAVSDMDQYLAENTRVEVLDETLEISASGRISADVTLSLPEKEYQKLVVNLLNGKVSIDGVSAIDLLVSSKNGELELTDAVAVNLALDLINGDIKFDGSFVDGKATLTNGGVRLTQRDNRAKNLTAKNINGDIKLSVPEALSLTGHVKTVFGGYKTRLRLDKPFESGKNGAAVVRSGTENLTFDLEIKSGTIWLKDGEENLCKKD